MLPVSLASTVPAFTWTIYPLPGVQPAAMADVEVHTVVVVCLGALGTALILSAAGITL